MLYAFSAKALPKLATIPAITKKAARNIKSLFLLLMLVFLCLFNDLCNTIYNVYGYYCQVLLYRIKKLGRTRVFCLFSFGFFFNGFSFECCVENHEQGSTENEPADDIGNPVDSGEETANNVDNHENG